MPPFRYRRKQTVYFWDLRYIFRIGIYFIYEKIILRRRNA